MYASPSVLVLQHKRMAQIEEELAKSGGRHQAVPIAPYCGEQAEVGVRPRRRVRYCCPWAVGTCTRFLEGSKKVKVRASARPTIRGGDMEEIFHDPSTVFLGSSDRVKVVKGYVDLRHKLDAFEDKHKDMARRAAT